MNELVCPRCSNIMIEYKENHYKCSCGARAVQLTLDDEEPCLEEKNKQH